MTPWTIHYPKTLPFKYAVKNYNSTVKGLGYIKKDSVLLDNENKTLFSPEEWELFEQFNFDLYVLKIITTFKGNLLTDKVNKNNIFDRSK